MAEQQQPPAQSPFISSSSGGGFPPAKPEHSRPTQEEEEEEEEDEEDDPEERRPWEEDDFGDSEVLDLTGGAGGFKHPPFTVCFPGEKAALPDFEPEPKKPVKEEEAKKPSWKDEVSDSPPPSSPEEDEEVPPDRRPTAPVITPLAPLAPAPIKEESARKRGPSGSADETFFALPAASASLMHSSAESPDLQELPSKPALPGREDFPSMLHESSASLPSLSPLSAPPVQGLAVSGSAPAQPPFVEPFRQLYLESTSDLPIVAQTESHSDLNLEEAQQQLPQALIVDHVKEDISLFVPLKGALSEKERTEEGGTDILAIQESEISAEYVDFKPFSPVWESRLLDQEAGSLDDIFKMDGNSVNEAEMKPPATESYDAVAKASVSPESPVDPTGHVVAQTFEMSVAAPDAAAVPWLHDQISENQTDEKKIAEMEVHWSTVEFAQSVRATHPFSVEFNQEESGHVDVGATNVSDSLTPDLVQEACESEIYDAAGAQLTYTSKVDLVQTSESLPEPLNSEGLISPSQCIQSVQSPVLPDIVMEAPVNIAVPGLEAQPNISLLENLAPLVHEQQIKLGSEKPPSYEEAVNDPLMKTETHSSNSTAFKGFASVESTTLEEIGTPYISIACDLVQETKISNDNLPPGFSEFSKDVLGEFAYQSVQKHPQKEEESSPESDEMDFNKQWGSEVRREASGVLATSEQEKADDVHSSTVLNENKLLSGLSPGKVYMESFQLDSNLSKDSTYFLLDNPTVSAFIEEEKPLQMEELGKLISSEKVSGYREQEVEEDSLCMGEPSPFPITQDFLSKLAHSEAEVDNESYMEKEENESMRNGTKVEFLDKITPEKVPETAAEYLQSSSSSPQYHEVSAARLLSKELLPSAREELVCSIKLGALEIEEPKTSHFTREEKGDRPTASLTATLLLSARLGKASVVDLLYWRDIKKTGVVFGASLFLLLSLTVFSIVSVSAYIALALLSVTISYRIYRGVFQAIQKSDEGHPFKVYLDSDVAVSQELVQKYSNVALGHVNGTIKELRRLFLVEDLVDSLKFAVLMWVLTYVGALFNGLTLLILALISLFSVPIIYERHQAQIDHYLGLLNRSVKGGIAKIQAKIPGLKPKAE